MKNITIKEIAERAGVSKATVSRVLNNTKPVSEEVRQKVLEVIEDTNFVPSALGRSLSLKKSHLIGVVIPDMANPVFSRIIAGMEPYIRDKNYSLLITATDFNIEIGIKHIKILNDKSVDGLIFLAGMMNDALVDTLKAFKKPVVVIGSDMCGEDFPVIEIDNRRAAYDATQYLLNLGHKKIGMIRGPIGDRYAGRERYKGFKKALEESKLFNETFVVEGNYSFDHGYNGMLALLTRNSFPTAVFCANDLMAIGAIKCALDNGLSVPEQISIMGFDDVEIAQMYNPTLSTIRQPFEEKGLLAIEKLINRIESKDNDSKHMASVTLPYELVIRKSTRSPGNMGR